jgi:hypothetical protein
MRFWWSGAGRRKIQRVVHITFDNVHLTRDSPNVRLISSNAGTGRAPSHHDLKFIAQGHRHPRGRRSKFRA